jgi:hypothetical protein
MNSPPLDIQEKWFSGSTAYSIAKFGMSLVVLGLAGELRDKGIAVNALWPRTTIATSAIKNLLGGDRVMRMSRTPEIMADSAYLIFQKPARSFTGNFLIDDTFLAAEGVTDFEHYRVDPSEPLAPTFFVPDDPPPPRGSSSAAKDRFQQMSWLAARAGLAARLARLLKGTLLQVAENEPRAPANSGGLPRILTSDHTAIAQPNARIDASGRSLVRRYNRHRPHGSMSRTHAHPPTPFRSRPFA